MHLSSIASIEKTQKVGLEKKGTAGTPNPVVF